MPCAMIVNQVKCLPMSALCRGHQLIRSPRQREPKCSRRTGYHFDEIAPPHSITSSASKRVGWHRQVERHRCSTKSNFVGLLNRNVLIYVKTRLLGSRRQLFVPKKQHVSKVRLSLRSSNPEALMSALGQKQTSRHLRPERRLLVPIAVIRI